MKITVDYPALVGEFWGEDAPEWIKVLATECARSSQSAIARRLEVSPTMVNQALRNKYPGDLTRLEDLVTGVFMSAEVDCPSLGMVPAHVCRQWRDRSRQYTGVNLERVLMFRACNKCPRNAKGDAE